jgi:hypothetical protein
MEDKDNATTELFLKIDGTVEFGDTDGPRWISARGEWSVTPGTDDFTMKITRQFKAGVDNTDMGEFDYELERIYVGDMTMVGACVGITGVMRIPELSEREVGFFNMIDATNVRGGNDDGKIVE